jgi:magnesium transporter
MDVRYLTESSVEEHPVDQLPVLLQRADGFVWVDIPVFDDDDEKVLAENFGFHELALRACRERNHVPAIHAYPDYYFVVLHAPESGGGGHVHLLELDQFIGRRYIVTVHGPLNPAVPLEHALVETRGVLSRIERDRIHPRSPVDLSFAIVTALVRRQQALIGPVAQNVAALEQRVIGGKLGDPEQLLEEMFLIRHELLTVRTMAAQSHEIYARLAALGRFVPADDKPILQDLADQFDRVRGMADGEKEFLFGVMDLYQTRSTTKMTIAMERLAVLAAVTLPITAIASIYGMNVIVSQSTHLGHLLLVLAVMVLISGVLLRWTKKQGWW